jgi:hypothetical protein
VQSGYDEAGQRRGRLGDKLRFTVPQIEY